MNAAFCCTMFHFFLFAGMWREQAVAPNAPKECHSEEAVADEESSHFPGAEQTFGAKILRFRFAPLRMTLLWEMFENGK